MTLDVNPQATIGILDIGSNSVRLVVFDSIGKGLKPAFNEKVQCGLGRDLARTGKLSPEGKKCALKTLKGFKYLADAMGVSRLYAIATAAMRDASDGPAFAEKIRKETGIDVTIIDGNEEARLGALGVLSAFPKARGIVGDLGGGSLEFAHIDNGQVLETISLPLGVLRIGAQDDHRAYIQNQLACVPHEFCNHATLYVIGGTWRALAQAHMAEHKSKYAGKTKGYTMECTDLEEFAEKIALRSAAEIERLYEIDPKRAPFIPDAALLLSETAKTLGILRVIVSTAGLRDGLLQKIANDDIFMEPQ